METLKDRKESERARKHEWYMANRTELLKKHKAYRDRNREELAQKRRIYCKKVKKTCCDCGKVIVPAAKRCRPCHYKSKTQGFLCKGCRKPGEKQLAKGYCRPCYEKFARRKIKCKMCGLTRQLGGRGLCKFCYPKTLPLRECKECGRGDRKHIRGLCAACYGRLVHRNKKIICGDCGQRERYWSKDRCAGCSRKMYKQQKALRPYVSATGKAKYVVRIPHDPQRTESSGRHQEVPTQNLGAAASLVPVPS